MVNLCEELKESDNERSYNAAIELNNSGFQKYKKVDFDDAIADYTAALDIYPNLAVAYYNRGTVYYRLGELEPALTDLKKAVHLAPHMTEFKEALSECKRLIEEQR